MNLDQAIKANEALDQQIEVNNQRKEDVEKMLKAAIEVDGKRPSNGQLKAAYTLAICDGDYSKAYAIARYAYDLAYCYSDGWRERKEAMKDARDLQREVETLDRTAIEQLAMAEAS